MSGRGDNNKNGTSGSGASNQSNQPFTEADKAGKSNHGAQTGGQRSEPQAPKQDQSANRNTSTDKQRS